MVFDGRTALISGGASGLGLGIALAFGKAGMNLVLGYRDEAARNEADTILLAAGCQPALFVRLDVMNRDAWAAAADAAQARFGNIHVLVNNAGVSVFGQIDEASFADWDWVLGVNLGGVVNGLVAVLPRIRQHGEGGYVVNVGSMAGFLPGPQAGLYTTSKFAVRGLTESLRYSLAPTNIGISLLSPGLIATQAYRSALKRPDRFAASGFSRPADAASLDQLAPIFSTGMPPEEAGGRLLEGMRAGKFHIFTHPEFAEDLRGIADELIAALPDEAVPAERLAAEEMRRRATRLALERRIDISDLA